MKKINLRGLVFCMAMMLIIAAPGYCFYRDDVDPEQIKSKVKIQREKDRQRRQAYERKKEEEKQAAQQKQEDTSYTSQTQPKAKQDIVTSGQVAKTAQAPQQQYKRISRAPQPAAQKKVVAKEAPKPVVQAKKSRSNKGLILLMLIVASLVGAFIYKKKKG